MHTKKYKDRLIYEILDIYEVRYHYKDDELAYCYHELKQKSIEELKYIFKRLVQLNY